MIVIPYPLVIKPTILSPGTGLQQEATFTFISSIPLTIISFLFGFTSFNELLAVFLIINSSFEIVSELTILITCVAVILLLPIFI